MEACEVMNVDYLLAAAVCINGAWAVLNMANTASNARTAGQLSYASRTLQHAHAQVVLLALAVGRR